MEGHSQTEGLRRKTAVYFHAAYLPNLQSVKLRRVTVFFFSELKAKYERYRAHICFYGSLGSHIPILRHDLAQRREKRERGFDAERRAWSCFDHISALCSALQYNPGCVMWLER